VAFEAETCRSLQSGNGLGFCFGDHEGQATVVARNIVAAIRKAGGESCWHSETCWLPYVSAYLYNAADAEQRGCESGSRVIATCEQPNHARSVCPSWHAGEAAGAKQTCG